MATETTRIHERIDSVDARLSRIEAAVTTVAATCAICKPIVIGNGKDSIDTRVKALEVVSGLRSKGFWAVLAGVVACVSALTSTAVVAAVRMMSM